MTKLLDAITQISGLFKIKLFSRIFHLGFELFNQLRQRPRAKPASGSLSKALTALPANSTRSESGAFMFTTQLKGIEDRVTGLLARRRRHNPMLLVVGLLDRPLPRFQRWPWPLSQPLSAGATPSTWRAARPMVWIRESACRKPSLSASRIATRSPPAGPDPPPVYLHQHVVFPEAEVLDDLDPLDRVDLRVQQRTRTSFSAR